MKKNYYLLFFIILLSWISISKAEIPQAGTKEITNKKLELTTKRIHVVQRKLFQRALRFEIAPIFGSILGDPFNDSIAYGGEAIFHITEYLAIGGIYRKTKIWGSVNAEPLEDYWEITPDTSYVDYAAFGNFIVTPIYAKANFFGLHVIHFDFFFYGGSGIVRAIAKYTEQDDLGNKVDQESEGFNLAFDIGFGGRFYLTKWLALKIEVGNILYRDTVRSNKRFQWKVPLNMGLSFFLPPNRPKY